MMLPQTVALRDSWPAGLPQKTELTQVPFFPQKDYQCGPAALATSLANFKVKVTSDELIDQVYLPARQGSLQVEMLAAPRRYGMVSYQLAPRLEDLLREVAAGVPVVVLQNYGVGPFSKWHYAVIVGFDYQRGEVILRSGETERLTLAFPVLEYTWKASNYWAMVTLPPDRIAVTADESRWLEAVLAMERIGDALASKTAYASFLKRWPDNVTASVGMANRFHASGELNEAEHLLRRTTRRHPDSVPALNNLAQTLSDLGRHDEAMAVIDRAAALGGPFAASVAQTREAILQRRKQ